MQVCFGSATDAQARSAIGQNRTLAKDNVSFAKQTLKDVVEIFLNTGLGSAVGTLPYTSFLRDGAKPTYQKKAICIVCSNFMSEFWTFHLR
jgi:hypothetical protein